MDCEFKLFDFIPDEAREIRKTVFVGEQGFEDEFDETDNAAYHMVAFVGGTAAAVCRFFRSSGTDFTLGRLAVLKQYRGMALGGGLMAAAERAIYEMGGRSVSLHAQTRAAGFYEKSGYSPFKEPDEEQGCPHVWMRKLLSDIREAVL